MNIDQMINRHFGEGDDDEQAAHLNALGNALWEACRLGKADHEMQLCYISKHLDVHGKRLITGLAEFIELRKKENA